MVLNEQLTVGEVAAASLDAVVVLESKGIDYCCGGKRELGEVCRERGLDFHAVREELERALQQENPRETDWRTASLADLIRFIVSTHHEYLKLELPRLNDRMSKVFSAHGDKDPEMHQELSRILRGLWQELDGHMHKEEVILFPSIERLESAVKSGRPMPPTPFGTIRNPIAVMEREHDSAGLALQRMREVTRDYQVPEYACATVRALYDGCQELEADLRRHIHLENNILFPRIARLESTHC